MNGNILDDPMMRMMYQNTLLNLSNGVVSLIDKHVLSSVPLPENFIEPYTSQSVEARSAMDLTYSSLSVWIEEAKKANYFTKHFVTLSKMIMGGVTTMARGLMTLHVCGEDLSTAPMSIQDLISLSSYHIRKSYLGVLQTSRSNPEIGERLLLNQLSWTNTLLRLYRTKEKLETKPEIKNKKSEITGKTQKQLPEGDAIEAFEPFSDGEHAFSAAGAINAPGGFSSAKAFGPMEGKDAGFGIQGTEENEKSEMINEKLESGGADTEGSELNRRNSPFDSDNSSDPIDQEPVMTSEPKNTDSADSSLNREDFSPSTHGKQPILSQAEPIPGTPYQIDPEHPPEYFRILYQAVCRGKDSGKEGICFTDNEVYQLLADPEFCYFEKEMAAEFRRVIEEAN